MKNDKICKLINGANSWRMLVDGKDISFQSSTAADYFKKHYEALGYTVEVDESYWTDREK